MSISQPNQDQPIKPAESTNDVEDKSEPSKSSNLGEMNFRKMLSFLITGLGLVYLLLVLTGRINKDRFGQTEVAIFITVVLLNSEVIERLTKFGLGKDGVTFELEEKVNKVQQKQGEQQKDIEDIVAFLARDLLKDGKAYRQLEKLAGEEEFFYDRSKYNWAMDKELRRLRDLGLIESRSGERLSIRRLPTSDSDLRNYIKLTNRGLKYLALTKPSTEKNQDSIKE